MLAYAGLSVGEAPQSDAFEMKNYNSSKNIQLIPKARHQGSNGRLF